MSKSITIKVGGMSCSHCEKTVTEAAMSIEGVCDAKASAKKGVLKFKGEESVVPSVKEAIREQGFDVQ